MIAIHRCSKQWLNIHSYLIRRVRKKSTLIKFATIALLTFGGCKENPTQPNNTTNDTFNTGMSACYNNSEFLECFNVAGQQYIQESQNIGSKAAFDNRKIRNLACLNAHGGAVKYYYSDGTTEIQRPTNGKETCEPNY
jgi:hypothetical protein